ncbi:MAG: hypothetical protein EXS63_08955 [Candidatus Omnitrophica bacterium]|nr:hypothetical protein [Candidatus Omnitrophota bacterium]
MIPSKNLDYEYDEFLKSSEPEIIRAIPAYLKNLEKIGPKYGRFPIPTFYKPHWMSADQELMLKRASSTLNAVAGVAIRLYFEERHFSSLFQISPEIRELIQIDPGYSKGIVFGRFDGLLEGQSFKLLGFNSDVSAGSAYADHFEKALLEELPLAGFFKENQVKRTMRVQNILDMLLEVYEEFGGLETPRIAIVDWRNARTLHEFELLKVFFESKGYKTTIADPRELKYKGGKLYHKDFRIDMILRRASLEELVEKLDEIQDLIKAYRDRAVCMVNPLRSWLASTQTILSILTNPEYDHFFTENENKIKRECIPWTRSISDAEAFYRGKKSYLIDFLKDEKESLVIKPMPSHAGKGILIGKETRDQDWNEAIDRAIKENWVLQEYVNVPLMTVPEIVNKKLDFAYKRYNFNALVFGGKYAGGFVKLSQESVVNAARSGGFIPSLTADSAPERWNS